MKAEEKKNRALQKLHAIIEEAIASGADSIELEYVSAGLEVTYMIGDRGLGYVLTDRALVGGLLGLISGMAKLEHKSRSVMEWTRDGKPYPIPVEEYDNFGEAAYRLKLGKSQRR
jgi:hypothetical protein